jgi:hypothetical protein
MEKMMLRWERFKIWYSEEAGMEMLSVASILMSIFFVGVLFGMWV